MAKQGKKRATAQPPPERRTRRRPRPFWIALIAVIAALVAGWYALERRGPRVSIVRTPDQNVLLITIDTLRADALGCYGGTAATPTIDRLAAAGIRYTFAHAPAPLTLVAHASILSGLNPFQHGIRDNSGFRFPKSIPTLATRLRQDGFATAAFVGAFPLHSQFGLDIGFGVYDDNFKETALPTDFEMSERPATAVVAAARPWIAAQKGRWFAWVHVFDPHAPYRPPEPFASRYRANPYAGEVAATDAALASLIEPLNHRADRPTLVIVTGDHGEALGDHGEQTHGLFAYESTLRVPMILAQIVPSRNSGDDTGSGVRLRALGASARQVVSDEPVRHIDIVPTVLDALGRPIDASLPGRSLLTRAADPSAIVSYFEAMSASLNRGWAPLTGVIVGREKLVQLPIPELYDLQIDPAEQQNLIDRRQDRRRVLETRLRDLLPAPPGERRPEDLETVSRLSALGYVSGSEVHRGPYTEKDDPKRLIQIDRRIHEAIELFQRGNPGGAAAIYRDVIAQRPEMAVAYEHLAFVYWEAGRPNDAIATLQQAVAAGLSPPIIESKLGMYLSEMGRVREGLPWLERAASQPPVEIDTLNALGIGYARAGSEDRAISVFKRVLEIDPNNAMAWQNIGSVELQRGNGREARDAFHRAIDADANWAAAYTGLGVAERRLGNFDAAIASWRRAVELDAQQFDALYNLATELIAAGRVEEGRPYARRFVASAPPAQYARDVKGLEKYVR